MRQRATYWTVTNIELRTTVKICSLAPFLRELGMIKHYQKLIGEMNYSGDHKARFGRYEFCRVVDDTYPRLNRLLNCIPLTHKDEYVEVKVHVVPPSPKRQQPKHDSLFQRLRGRTGVLS